MPPAVRCLQGGESPPGPDRPLGEVADIFRRYGAPDRQTHAVSAVQQKVIDAIRACRTAQLGGHAERCPQCGFERYASSSCRHRPCPKCPTWATVQWVAAQRAEVLPTPSCHLVFTVPHALNALILGNKRLLLTLLFRTASQTLLPFGQHHLGGQLGATLVWHTWDQTRKAHCHLHCLVPAGALAEDGTHGVPTHPHCLCPVRALRTVCRATCLTAFQQAYHREAWRFAQASAWCGAPPGFTPLLAPLYGQAWVVDAKRSGAGPSQVLESLGRSIHRIAIANHRLLAVRDDCVRFT